MSSNPYTPPTGAVRDPPRSPSSPTVALLAGLGVSLCGALLLNVVVAMLYVLILIFLGRDPDAIALRQPLSGILSFVVGGASFLSGGYVCARLARRNERRLTAIIASLGTAAWLALALVAVSVLNYSVGSWTWGMVQVVATCLLVIAGGELGRRRNLAEAREANAATEA